MGNRGAAGGPPRELLLGRQVERARRGRSARLPPRAAGPGRPVVYNPRMIKLRSASSAAIWATSASDGFPSVM